MKYGVAETLDPEIILTINGEGFVGASFVLS